MIQEGQTIPLEDFTLIRCSGSDAEKFLQGQVTCDVREINENTSKLAACCDHKGRIFAIIRLFKRKEDFYFLILKELAENCLKEFKKYILSAAVNFETLGEQPTCLGLIHLKEHSNATANEVIQGDHYSLLEIPGIRKRFILIADNDNVASFLNLKKLVQEPARIWALLDMQDHYPQVTSNMIGLYTPHDLELPSKGAVSFDKGCYRGQEIISRMEFLGKIKYKLYYAVITTPPFLLAENTTLYNGDLASVGQIINAISIDTHETHALIRIDKQHYKTPLFLENSEEINVNWLK
jgi:folate-binding protein YgfZ